MELVCVIFYLGLERSFASLISQSLGTSVDFQLSESLEEAIAAQTGFALSPATSPALLAQRTRILAPDAITMRPFSWTFMKNLWPHMYEWNTGRGGDDDQLMRDLTVDNIAAYIFESISADDASGLLIMTMDLVLSKWPTFTTLRRRYGKQPKSTNSLADSGRQHLSRNVRRYPAYLGSAGNMDRGLFNPSEILHERRAADPAAQEWAHVVRTVLLHLVKVRTLRTCFTDEEFSSFLQRLLLGIRDTSEEYVQQQLSLPLLLGAATYSMAKSCRDLLTAGVRATAEVTASSANVLSERYGSALISACERADIDTCRIMIEQGADVNATYSLGFWETALIAACCSSVTSVSITHAHLEIPRMLLDHGANVNAVAHSGDFRTALIAACDRGNVQLCQMLIDYGANANLMSSRGLHRTPLIAAAAWSSPGWLGEGRRRGNPKDNIIRMRMCDLLLKNGADANAIVVSGQGIIFDTALCAATYHEDADLCSRFINCGAEVGPNECTFVNRTFRNHRLARTSCAPIVRRHKSL